MALVTATDEPKTYAALWVESPTESMQLTVELKASTTVAAACQAVYSAAAAMKGVPTTSDFDDLSRVLMLCIKPRGFPAIPVPVASKNIVLGVVLPSADPSIVVEKLIVSALLAAPAPKEVPAPQKGADVLLRERLIRFYAKHNPEKISDVDRLIEAYVSNETALFEALVAKYGPE